MTLTHVQQQRKWPKLRGLDRPYRGISSREFQASYFVSDYPLAGFLSGSVFSVNKELINPVSTDFYLGGSVDSSCENLCGLHLIDGLDCVF